MTPVSRCPPVSAGMSNTNTDMSRSSLANVFYISSGYQKVYNFKVEIATLAKIAIKNVR